MEGSDLNYYFNWIKTQLSSQVKEISFSIFARNVTSMLSQAIYGNYGKWQKESCIKIMPYWTWWISQITLLHFFFFWLASAQPFLSFLPLGIFHSRWKYLLLGDCQVGGLKGFTQLQRAYSCQAYVTGKEAASRGECRQTFGWETSWGSTHICLSWTTICGRNLRLGAVSRYF